MFSRFEDHIPEPDLIVQSSSVPVTKSRQTFTSKGLEIHTAREEERAALGALEPDSILKRWKCQEPTCNNEPRWCYIESVDGGVARHREISTGLLPTWVASIRLGKSTVERPSEKIISQMIPVKLKKKLTQAEQLKELLVTMKEVTTPATALPSSASIVSPAHETNTKRRRNSSAYSDLDDEYKQRPRKHHHHQRSYQGYRQNYHPSSHRRSSSSHRHYHSPDRHCSRRHRSQDHTHSYRHRSPGSHHSYRHRSPGSHHQTHCYHSPERRHSHSHYSQEPVSFQQKIQPRSYLTKATAVPSSSPARLPNDDKAVTMRLYCEWHAAKKPRLAHKFMEAYKALKDSCLSLYHIQKWEQNYGWTRFNIPEGIGLCLAEEAKAYMKDRQHQLIEN